MLQSLWRQRWAGASVPAHEELKRLLAEAKKKRDKEKDEETAEWSSEENRCCRTCSGSSRNSKTSSSGSAGLPELSEGSPEATGATAAARRIFTSLVQDGADLCEHLAEIAALGIAEDWCIDETEVRVLPSKTVGSGTFGVVVMGVFCGMKVAVKLPRSRIEGPVVKRLPEVCNHLRTLRRLRHPNIAMVHGAVIDPQQSRIGVVVEFVPGKRLDRFLGDEELADTLPDALVRCQIMTGVCCALVYMHSRTLAVTHGGIKHSAVIVEVTGAGSVRPRLLDFGLSRAMSRHSRPSGDLLPWTAPEVLREGVPRRHHADIYAFGHLIAYTATGRLPMTGRSSREIRRSLLRGTYAMPSWPKVCVFQPFCQFLVERCLTVEESQRPSAAQAHAELLLIPGKLGVDDSESSFFAETSPQTVGWDEGAADMCVSPRNQVGGASVHNSTKQRSPASSPMFEPVRHKGETGLGLPTLPEAEPLRDGRKQKIHTNTHAKLISLCEAMSRWSCPPSETACCPFHDRVKVAEEACHNLLKRPCKQGGLDFDEAAGKQCPSCGILGLEPFCTHCDICGKRLKAQALPCQSSQAAGAPEVHYSFSEPVRVSL